MAQSTLVTINLEEYFPRGERVIWDMKDWLYQEMILREKDFREKLKVHDWEAYAGRHVSLICSVDAIVPTWAFMLAATYLNRIAETVVVGDLEALELVLFRKSLDALELETLRDARVVIKGCGNLPVPVSAYVELTNRLQPVVKSIMFGEPCSTVPIFKAPK